MWLECINEVSGWCCNEVYRYPHNNYDFPTPLVLALFFVLVGASPTLIILLCKIFLIGASLSEPHTYRTAVQNPPYIIELVYRLYK